MNIRISTNEYVGDVSRETTIEIEDAPEAADYEAYKQFKEIAFPKQQPLAPLPVTLTFNITASEKLDPHTLAQAVQDQMTQAFESAARRLKGGSV